MLLERGTKYVLPSTWLYALVLVGSKPSVSVDAWALAQPTASVAASDAVRIFNVMATPR